MLVKRSIVEVGSVSVWGGGGWKIQKSAGAASWYQGSPSLWITGFQNWPTDTTRGGEGEKE